MQARDSADTVEKMDVLHIMTAKDDWPIYQPLQSWSSDFHIQGGPKKVSHYH